MKKRILSMLLVVVMLVSLFPASIFAHADTVSAKPFTLLNGSAIVGDGIQYSKQMPKTWTRGEIAEEGKLPQVYFMGHTDPASSAQALWDYYQANGYEEGMRYFDLDVLPTIFRRLVVDYVYFDKAVEVVSLWLDEFLSAYYAIGGELDGIIVDLEYMSSHAHYITDDFLGKYVTPENGDAYFDYGDGELFTRIEQNAGYSDLRARLEELGFVFTTADQYNNSSEVTKFDSVIANDQNVVRVPHSELLTIMDKLSVNPHSLAEGPSAGVDYIYNDWTVAAEKSVSRSIWNQVMDEMERDAINEAVLVPLLKYFPDATLSDYQAAAQHSYNETLVWNGQPESYSNIYPAGNATNMNAYSGRAKSTPDGYIGSWSATAFNSALFEVKFAKDALAVAQDYYGINKQHVEVASYSYGRMEEYKDDGTGVLAGKVYDGAYSETPYYTEVMLHLGLATDEPFMGYIIDSEETKKEEQYGGVGYKACIEIFDDILAELTAVAGYSDRKPIRTAANWNGSYILSGMYAGGRNIWRITPDTSVVSLADFNQTTNNGDPTFVIDGLTITFPGGRIVETDITIDGVQVLEDGSKVTHTAGSCGYWIETSADVEPVITGTAGRYTDKTLYSETADIKTIAADEIYHNITMYDAVNGRVVTNTTADADYRIVWVNNSAVAKKAIVKNNGVQIATFAALAGQDGVFTGTVHSHDSAAVNLTIVYTDLDSVGNTPSTELGENFTENYLKNQTAHIYLQGQGDVIIDDDDVAYFKYENGVPTVSDAENYNVKFMFSEETGIPTLYLKGAAIKDSVIIGKNGCNFFDLDIVVEADSSIITTDTIPVDASALNGTITFTGAGNLTLQTGGLHAIKSTAKLVFKDANVDITTTKTGDGSYNYAAVWVNGANIVVDGGELNVTAAGGACLWIGEINGVSGKYTINIKNNAQVTASCSDSRPAIACGGKIYVNNAGLSVTSTAGSYFASSEPIVSNAHYHDAVNNTVVISNSFTTIGQNKSATCLQAGSTAGLMCNHCGETYKAATEIPALGHKETVRYEYVSASERTKITYCVNCDAETADRETITVSTQTVSFKSYGYYNDSYYIGQTNGVWQPGISNTVSINEGEADKYYTVKPISEENKNTVWYADGNVYNYNVRFSWPLGGVPTIYLKDANFYSNSTPLTITAGDLPVNIIVESESSLISVSEPSSNTAISYSGTGVLTITSRGNAKLTVAAEENAAIDAPGGLTIKDAYVVARGCAKGGNTGGNYASLRTGTSSNPADFIVDHSIVDIYAYGNSFVKRAKDIKVINGSTFTAKYLGLGKKDLDAAAITHSGDFMISGSTVKVYANSTFTGYHTASHIMLEKVPVMIGVTAQAGSWTGYNLTGTTYKADYERTVALAKPFQESQIDLYTYFETTPCEHSADPAAEATRVKCKERAICVDCGLAFGELEEHTYDGVPDCVTNITCDVCETVISKNVGHTWVDAPAVAPTCTKPGLTAGRYCTACDAPDPENMQTIVPATGHSEVVREAVAATCTTDGLTEGVQCETCGEWIVAQQTIKGQHTRVEDPAIAATCTTPGLSAGAHCSVCYTVLSAQEVYDPLGHAEGEPVIEITGATPCVDPSHYNLVTKCTRCDDVLSTVQGTEVLDHKLEYALVDNEHTFTCADCGYVESSMTYAYEDYGAISAYLQFYQENDLITYNYFNTNAPVYYCTVDGFVSLTAEDGVSKADEYNYNIKAMFVDGKLKIYLRDAEVYEDRRRPLMVIGDGYSQEKGYITDFSVDIIVESDSSLIAAGSSAGSSTTNAITNRANGLLTISSVNDAKLTLKSIEANGNTVTSVTVDSVGSVRLENANVEISNVYQTQALHIGNSTVNSHLEVINSKLSVTTNSGNAANAIKLAGSAGNVTFTNSQVTVKMNNHGGYGAAIYMLGEFNINRSDVEINVNKVPFQMTPTIDANTTAKYGEYTWSTANKDYSYAGGQTFSSVHTGYMGHFVATHACLEGEAVQIAPEHPCDDKMVDVFSCVVCGKQLRTAESAVDNENVVGHTDGVPSRENDTETTYDMVTRCTVCGDVTKTETIEKILTKTAYVKIRTTGFTITNNNVPKYYKVTDSTIVEEITDSALYNTYNIKVEFPETDAQGNENNTVYIYLKDLNLDAVTALASNANNKENTGLTIGSDSYKEFACEIVVESESSIKGYGASSSTAAGAVYAVNTDGLTIRSEDHALLTLADTNGNTLVSNGCGLKLIDANVVMNGKHYTTLRAVGDLEIENSILTLNNANSVTYPVMLSTAYNSLDGTTSGNITITNSKVTSTMLEGYTPNQFWRFNGRLTIDRSDFVIKSNNSGGSGSSLSTLPYLTNCTAVYGAYATYGTSTGKTFTDAMQGIDGAGVGFLMTTHTCGGGEVTTQQNTEKPCCGVLDKYTACAGWKTVTETIDEVEVTTIVRCDTVIKEVGEGGVDPNPAAHDFVGDWQKELTVEPTTSTSGEYVLYKTCSVCDAKKYETVSDDSEVRKTYTIHPTKTGFIHIGGGSTSAGEAKVTVYNDDVAKYYTVSGNTATEIVDPEQYEDYNIKIVFPNADAQGNANNTVYVYLNELTLDNAANYQYGLRIGDATYNNFACHIIVESASSIDAGGAGGNGGAIGSVITGGLTISSETDDATLTLNSKNGTTLASSACGLTLKNANLTSTFTYYSNIWVKGNMLIENSTVVLGQNATGSPYEILLSDSYSSLTGNAYDLTIKNSDVTTVYYSGNTQNVGMLSCKGNFLIYRSDVNIQANKVPFYMTPTITNAATTAYGQYAGSQATNAYTYEPGQVFTSVHTVLSGYMGSFKSTHSCGDDNPELVAPTADCAEFYNLHYVCECCGADLGTVTSNEPYDSGAQRPDHTPGEVVKEGTGTSYALVTYCQNCYAEIGRETINNADADSTVAVKFHGVSLTVKKNDEFVYYQISDGGASTLSSASGAHNLKLIFRTKENRLYIYLGGMQYVGGNSDLGLTIGTSSGGDSNNFACSIIVEADTTIQMGGSSNSQAAIRAYNTDTLTITSVNNAKLIARVTNTALVIASYSATTFSNANVEIYNGGYDSPVGLYVKGDLTIENSKVLISKDSGYNGQQRSILLSDTTSAVEGTYNLTIKNSDVDITLATSGKTAVNYGGELKIDRSDVTVDSAGKAFTGEPTELKNAVVASGAATSADYSTTHTHGGGATVAGEDPVASCSPYMGMKEHCAFPGCNEYSIVPDENTVNENATDHTAGDPVKTNVDNEAGTYDLFTYCTECGSQIGEAKHCTGANETVPVAFKTTSNKIDILKNDEFVYYTVTTSGTWNKLTGDTSAYNFKAIYRNAEGRLYIYLKGLEVSTSGANEGLIIGTSGSADSDNFACTITVEATTTLNSSGNNDNRAAIIAYNTAGLTFTSVNNAQLSAASTNMGMVIRSWSDTTFKNANVVLNNAGYSAITGLYVRGNLLVEDSTLVIKKGDGGYGGQQRAILLSDATDSLSGAYNMTVRNSTLDVQNLAGNHGALSFGGALTIERSDVEISAYNYAFTNSPELIAAGETTYISHGDNPETDYSEFAGKTAGTKVAGVHAIKYFSTTHAHGGGEKTLTGTTGEVCENKYNVYDVTCAFPGCEEIGTEQELVEDYVPADHTWEETNKVTQDATTTEAGYVETTFTCTVCGATKVEREDLDILDSTYFQYYSSTHSLVPVEVIEGDEPKYFVSEQHNKGSEETPVYFYYLAPTTVQDEANDPWNVKLVYVDGVPTMYLKDLYLDNQIGLVVGGKLSGTGNGDGIATKGTSDWNIVLEGTNTITKKADTGAAYGNGNYYKNSALNLLTTGNVTITGAEGSSLILKSDYEYNNNRGGVIHAYGDLTLDDVTVDIAGSAGWGEASIGIRVTGGDLTVKGGNLTVTADTYLRRFFLIEKSGEKGGNIYIQDEANVTCTANNYAKPGTGVAFVETAGNVTVESDCIVNFSIVNEHLFSNDPVINGNCAVTLTDKSFTVGACAHTSRTAQAEIPSTCTENGTAAHWLCSCGALFETEESVTPVTLKDLELPLASHGTGIWDKVPESGKDATCMESGYYEMYLKCQYCGVDLGEDPIEVEIPPLANGHQWVDVPNSMADATYRNLGTKTQRCAVDGCEAEQTVYAPAKFYGTNVDLGNSLNINFYFYANLDNVDYEGAYALFTRTYANAATEVTRVDREDWIDNRDFFQITYSDIAAKEMGDTVSVMVYDKNGNVIVAAYDKNTGNVIPKTTSVEDYLYKMLGTQTEKTELSTLLVDTLNYGAAMQNLFEYNDANLVNADLSDEQKNWATEARDLENVETSFKKSSNKYFGTSFVMRSNISMNMYVAADSVGTNGYVKVSFYTKGNESEKTTYTIEEFTTVGRYAIFNLDNAVELADGEHILIPAKSDLYMSFDFYDDAGNKVVTVTDESVLEYMTRLNTDYAVTIMQFMDGAKAYFAN